MITTFTSSQLKDVLLDPQALAQKDVYFTISPKETEENLLVILSGKNGTEFNKTLCFINRFPGVIIYRVLYGQGLCMIQKNDEIGEAKEVRVLGLRPGVEVEVPSGYAHTIANTGRGFLVLANNIPKDAKYIDSESLIKKNGLAYYVVDKKGDIGFEKNSQYSFYPQITNY